MNARLPRITIDRGSTAPAIIVDLPQRGLGAVATVFPAGGARHEKVDDAGLFATVASFFRHARAKDRQFGTVLEQIGGRWIVDVDWDKTVIGVSAPARSLPDAQRLLIDLVNNTWTEPTAAAARADRLAHLKASLQQPRVRATVALRSAIFGGTSRFSRLTGGDPCAVASFEPDKLLQTFIRMKNSPAAVVAAGDLCHVDTTLLASALGRPTHGPAEKATKPPAEPAPWTHAHQRYVGDLIHIVLGQACDIPDRKSADAAVLEAILGSGPTSRLARRLRDEERLAYGVSARISRWHRGGCFLVRTEASGDRTAQAIAVIKDTLQLFIDQGPSSDEVKVAKARIRGAVMARLDTSLPVLQSLADMVVRGLDHEHFATYLDRLDSVSVDSVRALAAVYLSPAGLATVAQSI